MKKKGADFKVVATSEWDVWANITYSNIHYQNQVSNSNVGTEKMLEFLKNFDHSLDSKNLVQFQAIKNLDFEIVSELYHSFKNSNNLGSILNIQARDLLEKSPNGVDLITYSFPCQDLSVAGNLHGFNKGMKKGDNTRSGLLWQIERILDQLESEGCLPKYLLLENVKNMLSSRHREDYEIWLKKLNKLGYNTQTYFLDASKYDIPQDRRRIFALSVLKKHNKKFRDTLRETGKIVELDPENIPYNLSKELGLQKNLEDLLKLDYHQKKYKKEALLAIPNWTLSREKMLEANPLLVMPIANAKNFNFIGNYKEINNFLIRKTVRTITTKQDRNPNAGIILLNGTSLETKKPKLNKTRSNYRFLTPRETFLLMGFDENDFENTIKHDFLEKRRDVLYRQAGNSIVVNVLVAIFNKILEMENKND